MSEMNEPYQEYREKPWGHEIIYTPSGLPYAGKVLHVKKGCRLSLQYHDQKKETLMLLDGSVLLWLGDSVESIAKIPMEAGRGYTITPMQVHRIEALEDSRVLEVSTPEAGTTARLEDDYHRDDEVR